MKIANISQTLSLLSIGNSVIRNVTSERDHDIGTIGSKTLKQTYHDKI